MVNPADLAQIVGRENVLLRDSAGEYAVSGVVPAAVAVPRTREEAVAVVGLAQSQGWALTVFGGGTQMGMGNPPTSLDLVLSTRGLDRVVDYQPDDMTVTVEPGARLSALSELLAARGQFLPLDPPLPARATAGGTMASAASGPWRAQFGTPRDWIIGCRVVGPDGKEVRGGGQVVKNVAGYDLPKLYTGSYGTLGLITEVTFKVMPHPGTQAYARATLHTAEDAEYLLGRVLNSDLQPSVAELVYESSADRWVLFFQFIHVPEALRWQLGKLQELAANRAEAVDEATGAAVLTGLRDRPGAEPFVAQLGTVSSLSARVADRAARLMRKYGLELRISAHAATGQVLVCAGEEATAALAADLRTIASEAGATCVFRKLPGALVGKVEPWGAPGAELTLMRGIKKTLDPVAMFSPGRFVGGI